MKITLKCKKPIALDSPDHLHPWGTRRDNSRNPRFITKLERLFGNRQFSVLDLGCSGGGFVRDCFESGNVAVGLEGSDYSKKTGRAEWKTIPSNLFTCDITKPFQLYMDRKEAKFDIITMWEVIEHIKEEDLPQLFENIRQHMKLSSLVIISTTSKSDVIDGAELHQCRHGKDWWLQIAAKEGFVASTAHESYFRGQYIRGHLDTERDFHLILKPYGFHNSKLEPPKESPAAILFDHWNGSEAQKAIKKLVMGE